MKFIAYASLVIQDSYDEYECDKWVGIKKEGEIEFRWRISSNNEIEVISGVYDNPLEAIACAKRMYVNLFNFLFKHQIFVVADGYDTFYYPNIFPEDELEKKYDLGDEVHFIWPVNHRCSPLGVNVFEVNDSLDEIDDHYTKAPISFKMVVTEEKPFIFDDIDAECIDYSREASMFLHKIFLAERAKNFGDKMSIYCSMLEGLTPREEKDEVVRSEIDKLITSIDDLNVSKSEKDKIRTALENLKYISAKGRCLRTTSLYANEFYNGVNVKRIIDEAYKIRSAYSHGDEIDKSKNKNAHLITLVALDVINNYFKTI